MTRILFHPVWRLPAAFVCALFWLNQMDSASGMMLWSAFFLYPYFVLFFILELVRLMGLSLQKFFTTLSLIWLSLFSCILAAEGALLSYETLRPTKKITMPEDWKLRSADRKDSPNSFYWQGEFHAKDDEGFRHVGLWPKKSQRKRILAIGDSLTYGLGVKEADTWPYQLQQLLDPKYEVLNLGVVGLNSTQIYQLLEHHIDEFKPDLVVYGVCLNDLLPETEAQDKADNGYAPPIPHWIRDPLITKTRLGATIDTGYNKLLLRLHLRKDFIDAIWEHHEDYFKRFERDMQYLNTVAISRNAPPIIGMVLDQYPQEYSPSQNLAIMLESTMRDAGIDVIPSSDYYEQYNGKAFFVSPWEGHPNAEGYRIFAERFAKEIIGQ